MKKFQALLWVLILVSCSSNQPISPTSEGPPTFKASPTGTALPPTQTPEPASTSVPTRTPVWTPLPTFPPKEGMETLESWIQGTFDCLLPCWGGIIPGKTHWQKTLQVLAQLSGFTTVNISDNIICDFGKCNGVAWSLYPETLAEGVFYTKSPPDLVHLIHIKLQNAGTQKTYLLGHIGLPEIFSSYGTPAMILFFSQPHLPAEKFIELTLVYPEKQFIIKYLKKAELSEGNVVSCGQDTNIELIILDNPEQLTSLYAIATAPETKELHLDAGRKSVEEATGMTIDAFYQTFNQRNAPCVSTPINIWPR
jgi:hypothetical protein